MASGAFIVFILWDMKHHLKEKLLSSLLVPQPSNATGIIMNFVAIVEIALLTEFLFCCYHVILLLFYFISAAIVASLFYFRFK